MDKQAQVLIQRNVNSTKSIDVDKPLYNFFRSQSRILKFKGAKAWPAGLYLWTWRASDSTTQSGKLIVVD